MRVLVTGARGQLGRELVDRAPEHIDLLTPDRNALDLSRSEELPARLTELAPESVVNAAAFTDVDGAEERPEEARCLNEVVPAVVATWCAERGVGLLHVSTDFVFDGCASRPYSPGDEARPLGIYGATKWAGERAVRQGHPTAVVVRTSWLYSRFGTNFVKTMLRVLREKGAVRVVCDQVGSPTWAGGLASALWQWVATDQAGVWHWADAGVASWYDLAVAVAEEGEVRGWIDPGSTVTPVETEEFPRPAQRPSYSVLDSSASHAALDTTPVHWRTQLRNMFDGLEEADLA